MEPSLDDRDQLTALSEGRWVARYLAARWAGDPEIERTGFGRCAYAAAYLLRLETGTLDRWREFRRAECWPDEPPEYRPPEPVPVSRAPAAGFWDRSD